MKTVSVELAEKLAKAGYPQTDIKFYYLYDKLMYNVYGYDLTGVWAAPTADEILERLPGEVKMSDGQEYELYIYPSHGYRKGQWKITYKLSAEWIYFAEDSLVEAAGKMWIYLKENNLLTHSGISI